MEVWLNGFFVVVLSAVLGFIVLGISILISDGTLGLKRRMKASLDTLRSVNWHQTLRSYFTMPSDLNWRLIVLGSLICVIAAAASPYVTLKLGLGVDLSYGGMFLAAVLLGRHARGNRLAIELNIIQTMINVVSGVAFMVVILASFHYIQVVFNRDIGFNPAWWQVSIWLYVSATLGVFMGMLPRRVILDDNTLPWPTGVAVLSVAETLSDQQASQAVAQRRSVLTVSTAVTGFLTFLKDGLGVITPMIGNAPLKLMLGLEFAAIGSGMLIPLAVGLSGLLGVWFFVTFGPTVATFAALSGTAVEHWEQCKEMIGDPKLRETAETVAFFGKNCGSASAFVAEPGALFKYVVQWMMWPATAMMVAASLTSVLVPLVRNFFAYRNRTAGTAQISKADEFVPLWWTWTGITVCVALLVWLQDAWFAMPWQQVLVAVAIQPLLIIAGLRVLGLTGQGPVSLMANATQCVFGLIWPAHIQQNLNAAHISADPQASSESTVASFWVARRLGGRFRTLIIAQLIVIPIGAIVLPVVFSMLVSKYGIGTDPGQLSAPTALKIASLAIVMEKGLSALPYGAVTASIIGAILGIVIELLLMVRKTDGTERFWWLPIPSAFGFALILPPFLTIGMAVGSVISAVWRKFSTEQQGSYAMYAAPLAAGLVAGEAIVGAILLPLLAVLVELLKPYL